MGFLYRELKKKMEEKVFFFLSLDDGARSWSATAPFGIIRKKLDAVERDGEADKSAADSSHQELGEEGSHQES
ncbi:hypothetical protein YC2023_116342 [Brassica napus]